MFRDEGRSFLQWLGEAELRQKMQGRLIVVHLVCRDMTVALNVSQKGEKQTRKIYMYLYICSFLFFVY